MFSQAYWHHTVRAQKAMLFRAVEAIIASQNNDQKLRALKSDFIKMVISLPESLYTLPPLQKPIPQPPLQKTIFGIDAGTAPTIAIQSGSNLAATDAAVLSWLHGRLFNSKQPEAMLIEGILSRRLFKRLWVVSREMEPTIWEHILSLWSQLKRIQRHKVAHKYEEELGKRLGDKGFKDVTEMAKETASDLIDRATRGYKPWLLIDIPGKRPGSDVPLYYVLEGQRRSLRKDDRTVGTLQKSEVWDQYAKNLLAAAGKVRVFCDPELVDSVEASIDWREGIEILITSLEKVIFEQKVPEPE